MQKELGKKCDDTMIATEENEMDIKDLARFFGVTW